MFNKTGDKENTLAGVTIRRGPEHLRGQFGSATADIGAGSVVPDMTLTFMSGVRRSIADLFRQVDCARPALGLLFPGEQGHRNLPRVLVSDPKLVE